MRGAEMIPETVRRPRRRRRSLSVVSTLAFALVALGCVPTTPGVPPPDLPAGVGVRWLQDTGGSLVGDEGTYSPSLDAFSLLGGTVTGPTPATPASITLPPTLLDLIGAISGTATAPDGTARLPWNGFAGEGISMTATDPTEGDWTLHFPGGSCKMATVGFLYQIQMVSPSPDGTKVAFRSTDFDGGSRIEVKGLVNGAECPPITAAQYQADSPTPSTAGQVLVWAPDSSALVYRVSRGGTGIEQLPAHAGSSASEVVAPSAGVIVPMGWSVENRLLYSRRTIEGGTPVWRLITWSIGGGPERVIDKASFPPAYPGYPTPLTRGALYAYLTYGYFVPGTNSIVYNDGSSTVTNSQGSTFPRYHVARRTDADGATSKAIRGTRPPLAWHQEALEDGAFEPPFDLIDVPNAEFVDRFVR